MYGVFPFAVGKPRTSKNPLSENPPKNPPKNPRFSSKLFDQNPLREISALRECIFFGRVGGGP